MDDWEVVYRYTRADAISDGVLVDVTDAAAKIGFKVPVAITSAVYDGCIRTTLHGQNEEGRLYDMLFMLLITAKGSDSDTVFFEVMFQRSKGKTEIVKLKAIIGPGDDPAPVLTILYPYED